MQSVARGMELLNSLLAAHSGQKIKLAPFLRSLNNEDLDSLLWIVFVGRIMTDGKSAAQAVSSARNYTSKISKLGREKTESFVADVPKGSLTRYQSLVGPLAKAKQ